VHSLEPVQQHRAVFLLEHVGPDLDDVIRPHAGWQTAVSRDRAR
jgi:hypothetical protein